MIQNLMLVWCVVMVVLLSWLAYEVIMTVISERRAKRNWPTGMSTSTFTPQFFELLKQDITRLSD